MRKVLLWSLALVLILTKPCLATDINGDHILSLANMKREDATPDKITSILGAPARVEENNKKSWWYYTNGKTSMVICWNKRTDALEKMSFNSEEVVKSTFDVNLSKRLRSGVTDITQALKLLGMPKDMTIKESTQEMHYAYRNSVLRLFFRDRTLVDFCLY